MRKETLAQVFFCEFCQMFNNTFFTERLQATGSKRVRFKKETKLEINKWKAKTNKERVYFLYIMYVK